MIRWLYVHAGLSSASGAWYLWWSGIGSILVVWLASMLLLWWHRSCLGRWWCPLIGRHTYADPKDGVTRKLCWAHHPDVRRKNLSRARIAEIQQRRHIYLGRRPGRG